MDWGLLEGLGILARELSTQLQIHEDGRFNPKLGPKRISRKLSTLNPKP